MQARGDVVRVWQDSGFSPWFPPMNRILLLALWILSVPAQATPDHAFDVYAAPARRVDIGAGRHLDLRCSGSGAPTVILDIGLGMSSLSWRHVQPALARITRVCSYDRAGFGFSDPGPLPRDAGSEADDLHALVKAADVTTPLLLVGHSLGSYIARIYASRHPDDVTGLVVIDLPAGDFNEYAPEVAALQARMNREDLESGPYQRCAKAARRGTLVHPVGADADCMPPVHLEFSDRLNASVRAHAARSAYWDALIAEKQAWATATPAALTAAGRDYADLPLVILAADGSNAYLPPDLRKQVDAAWQASYARLAAYSTRGVVVPVARSSHNMFDDRPDAIVDAVTRLVGELRRLRTAD